jgi:hypothetical protein
MSLRAHATTLVLDPAERAALEHLVRCSSEEARLVERARLVLGAADGRTNRALARQFGLGRKKVGLWRDRYVARRQAMPDASPRDLLQDDPRCGAPDRITPEQWVDLLALVTAAPASKGVPITHWTHRVLARAAVDQGLVPTIAPTTVGRFLAQCALQPHRVEEWMNRKADPGFDARAARVKALVTAAVAPGHDPQHAVLSFDEKTGMQARERIAPTKPMTIGYAERPEFEYVRHGTRVLFGLMNVATGTITAVLAPRRTNDDTARVLKDLLRTQLGAGATRVTLLLDQLNTHMSLDLVAAVAELCHLPRPDLCELDTMAKRRAWLERDDKPIVFCFTPKHASWLNPIEIWFGVLAGKVLRRGSFASLADLDEKVLRFTTYYNQKLAHPYRFRPWKAAPTSVKEAA